MAAPTDFSGCKTLYDCFAVKRSSTPNDEDIRDDALAKYSEGCRVVKELGVYQGITFARFLTVDGVEEVVGVDISLKLYRQSIEQIVDEYVNASDGLKSITLLEMSSTDAASVSDCDFLHIDSWHNANHLMQELVLHAPSVSRRIAFHDVNQGNRKLFKVVLRFIQEIQPNTWKIIEDYDKGKCGYTIIERIENA